MRESNPYHKLTFKGQKRNEALLTYSTEYFEFQGDFYNESFSRNTYLLKGFSIPTGQQAIITREVTGLQVNDRIHYGDEGGIITEVKRIRIRTARRDKWVGRQWDYIYVID